MIEKLISLAGRMELGFDPGILYSILGVVGAMPLCLLVASLRGETLEKARKLTFSFIETWGGFAPKGLRGWITLSLGSTVGFALLWGLAQTLNTLGKDIVPYTSAAFHHFGKMNTAWSVENWHEWEAFLREIRRHYNCKHPEHDLMVNRQTFYIFKSSIGATAVRAMRTLFMFSVLLFFAGLFDLRNKKFRKRGMAALMVAIFAAAAFTFTWSARQESYVSEAFLVNNDLGEDCQANEPESHLAYK
ncbi:MAG: hypothetical protein ACE5HS_19585 [bacterium]